MNKYEYKNLFLVRNNKRASINYTQHVLLSFVVNLAIKLKQIFMG